MKGCILVLHSMEWSQLNLSAAYVGHILPQVGLLLSLYITSSSHLVTLVGSNFLFVNSFYLFVKFICHQSHFGAALSG